jgi:hypothetical protein
LPLRFADHELAFEAGWYEFDTDLPNFIHFSYVRLWHV